MILGDGFRNLLDECGLSRSWRSDDYAPLAPSNGRDQVQHSHRHIVAALRQLERSVGSMLVSLVNSTVPLYSSGLAPLYLLDLGQLSDWDLPAAVLPGLAGPANQHALAQRKF